MLVGPVGTGKSSAMKILQSYMIKTHNPNSFRFIESRIIIRDFSKHKYVGLEWYSYNYKSGIHGGEYPDPQTLCIDDLGLENRESTHYGESVDVMGELMTDRYSIFTDPKYRKLTHATSNLSPDGLKGVYSERLYDRFREMFNVIPLTGKSKRK